MEIKILCPLWGMENWTQPEALNRIRLAGYDGIDTWIPKDLGLKRQMFDYLQKHNMSIVTHQHQAEGATFNRFKQSFEKNLHICREPSPILINSHTGRDYFSIQQNLELIDIAEDFTQKTGIQVVHETHRGRMGAYPQIAEELFRLRSKYLITADFSHWVCVSESFLENFDSVLQEAIRRTRHIHLRVGYEQGPQIPDPRAPEWDYATIHFLRWWDDIVKFNQLAATKILPMTTEFGPPPYMQTIPFTKQPVADQFEINCYIKDLIGKRYVEFRTGS